jgi:hypothetical protein
MQRVFKRRIEPEINKKTIFHVMTAHKHGTVFNELYKLDDELENIIHDYQNTDQVIGNKFVIESYKPRSKILKDYIKNNSKN